MTHFVTCADQIKEFISKIVDSDFTHAKWLNTLSYLENCGARKIALCEHPTEVKEEMLKHAAEEFRHAYYLKRQIEKFSFGPLEDYSRSNIIGGFASLHYLDLLELHTCRYLCEKEGLSPNALKGAAYLLITYAIELRAEELYPIYEEILRKRGSKVTVKSILIEEKEHLKEMEEGLGKLARGFHYANQVCQIEGYLCKQWIKRVSTS